MAGRKANSFPIKSSLLSELRECVAQRQIARGFQALRDSSDLDNVTPARANVAEFIGLSAQWADLGAFAPDILETLLSRFDSRTRAKLPFRDFLYLRMADGMLALATEDIEKALRDFSFVLEFPEEFDDPQSTAIVHFWKARCLRRRGDYQQALACAHKGRDAALALGFETMAALSEVLESWLLFQMGKLKEAERISHHAESVLRATDDYVTLGNIYSFYGRAARRAGSYDKAIEHFQHAIDQYRKRDQQHPNLARSLANIALAKREIALQLRRKIDTLAERRRKQGHCLPAKNGTAVDYRARLSQLHAEMLDNLGEASRIYSRHPNHHGIGTVELNYAYVYLDDGDFNRAESKAEHAYQLGKEKQDYILMGRARVVQCIVENARVEEEVSEGADPGSCARRALQFIQEAIDFAKHTQNQRLLANAYLWLGLTHCNSFFEDVEAANEAYDLAVSYRKGPQADNMTRELELLKQKITRAGTMDPKFKAWSSGSFGNKTFQQLTEEFAEIIIPRVWEREGRKVSRVASKLSISPKKVRRILDRVGRNQK